MEHEVAGLLGMALVGLQKKVILKAKLGSKKVIFRSLFSFEKTTFRLII